MSGEKEVKKLPREPRTAAQEQPRPEAPVPPQQEPRKPAPAPAAEAPASSSNNSPRPAGSVAWDGGGADEKWSTAANWSGDSVPGVNDHVVFDSTSGKDATIDGNIEVASIEVESSYPGILSGGSATITINSGDFNVRQGKFSAGTSTIKFGGSSNQMLTHPNGQTYHNVENAKSGGELAIQDPGTFNKIKAGAGTTTKVAVYSVTVTDLDLQGSAGNLAVFHCRRSLTEIPIKTDLVLKTRQTISYVDFKDINASKGLSIDATNNCKDSGGNTNIKFAPAP